MQPHPDFADITFPRSLTLGAIHLTPLSPDFVDEDLAAVQQTDKAGLIDGIFGPWPLGLTREMNLIDLAWHEREFTAKRSFSWILRNSEGAYLGCFYLFPELGKCGHASAAFWLCDLPARRELAVTLKAALAEWMSETLPETITITWNTRPDL